MNTLQKHIASQVNSVEEFISLVRCGMYFEIFDLADGTYEDFVERYKKENEDDS